MLTARFFRHSFSEYAPTPARMAGRTTLCAIGFAAKKKQKTNKKHSPEAVAADL
jgi:hypothetical protein